MIEIKNSKYKVIKQKSIDILLTSTMHGVPNIAKESSYLVKIIWFVCLIVSMVACAFFVSSSVFNYLDFEVVTQISTVYEKQSEFPAITICPQHGHLGKKSVFNCEFNTNNCESQIEFFLNSLSVLCFRFNTEIDINNQSIDVFNSTVGGINNGLVLDISAIKVYSYDYTELAVFIHNKSFKPLTLINKGFRFSSGSINTVILGRTFDEKLEYPYNDCYKNIDDFDQNKTIINFLKETNIIYTRAECIRYCENLINMEMSECNCVFSIDSSYNCTTSNNESIKNCYNNFLIELQKLNVIEICSKYCPLECDQIHLNMNVNTEHLPSIGKINGSKHPYLHHYKTYEDLQKTYFRIIVYYPELKYTYMKQQPQTVIADLVSNIGGTLGLFLGISFLSFIEIIEIAVEALVVIIKRN